jgi:tricarballylate dehydrogenase
VDDRHGVRFQAPLGGTLHLSRTNAFFLGGGKALVNAYYRAAAALGVEILYETEVVELAIDGRRFESATVHRGGERRVLRAKAMVAAAGGFESNLEWLREAWGRRPTTSSCAGRRTTAAGAEAAARGGREVR